MGRRRYTRTVKCEELGCNERALYEYDYAIDYYQACAESRPYRCCRHSAGKGVLSVDHLRTEWTSEPSRPLENYPNDPYRSFGHHGVLIGPGYYAEGRDFPIGTRIRITAEVLLPEDVIKEADRG